MDVSPSAELQIVYLKTNDNFHKKGAKELQGRVNVY